MAVTWSVIELQNGGAISSTGVFTAPANAGTYHVVATSNADESKSATATVIVPAAGTVQSGFTLLKKMVQERAAHTATLLPSGKVLIVDGGYLDINDLLVSMSSVELFDPSSDTFAPAGQTFVTREFHAATLLSSGQVLITGGNDFEDYPASLLPTPTAELYDPVSGSFVKTANMAVGRTGHTATLLADGRVLVAGGSSSAGVISSTGANSSAEIYDPMSGSFALTGSMASARYAHTATMLPDGKVLIAGGQNENGTAQASAELYDPQSGSFVPTGSMASGRTWHTATLLNNGTVLIKATALVRRFVRCSDLRI
jgi:hypothetical protein